jgi:hypothetical protein
MNLVETLGLALGAGFSSGLNLYATVATLGLLHALLAYAAAGAAPAEWRWGAALLAGGVALTSHGTKASARAAVNTSPEPFSNWILSFGEDVLAVWLTWMATAHPFATTMIVFALVAASAVVLYYLFCFARRASRRLFSSS